MPPLCAPYVMTLTPLAEGIRAYVSGPAAHIKLAGVDLATTSLALEDGHLVMHLAQGGTLLLLEFTASATNICGITFYTQQGDTLRGTDVLQLLGVPLAQTRAEVGVTEPVPAHDLAY
jgi:hypothetical protein